MNIQYWHQGSLSIRRPMVRHWLWLMLGSALLPGALMLYCALELPAAPARGAGPPGGIRARAAQTMRSALEFRRADPLPELGSQSPEAQSVLRYLRVHEVHQSLWDKLVSRVRLYMQRRHARLERTYG